MAPTFYNRCGDAAEEGCDPRDELAELDVLWERLRLKRYDLKRKINRLHSPIVRLLPPDVTSTIFEFCLPYFADRQTLPYAEEDLSIPLSLGAICSYWRDIAWSTPSLWSSLVIRVPIHTKSQTISGIAQEWLARSGQLPLSIRIYSDSYQKPVSALANIINQYSPRWSNLDFYIPDSYYRHFRATDNHAPILKSIRFYSINYATKCLNFKLTCPRLERATLSCFPMDGSNIHWDNLTHLTLCLMTIFDFFLILRKTPRLVFCKVSFPHTRIRKPIVGGPVLTPLRSLQLLMVSSVEEFLNNLTAPHLEEFSLPDYYNPSMEVITSFLRRSACSLRSLSMIFSIFPPYFESFVNLLQSMPSLNTLSIISTTNITSNFGNTVPEDYDPRSILQLVAKVLSSQNTSLQQGFLPNLEILEYTGKLCLRPGNFNDLYSLPPADNAAHGPLNVLKLDLHPATRIPKSIISYLSSLVEGGVTVDVLSNSEDILQSSIDYYRYKEDFMSRDWTDNMDSSLFR